MTSAEGAGSGNAANQGDGGGTGQGGVQATLFTQDQVNHFNAKARQGALTSFFKDLGMDSTPSVEDMKGILSKAGEFDKQQQGQQGDVERLTGQLGEANKKAERVPVLETDLQRAKIAADAGLKSRYWKYVEGSTDEEIQESVKTVLADIRSDAGDDGNEGERQSGAGGRPPEPNPQQGRGGGQPPAKTMQAGADAYRAKHKPKE